MWHSLPFINVDVNMNAEQDEDSHPESLPDTTPAHDDDPVQNDDSDPGKLVKRTKRRPRKKEQEGVASPGIVYLSRIPPFMKPHKVRHLLSQYGSVGRIYLQPEGRYFIYSKIHNLIV